MRTVRIVVALVVAATAVIAGAPDARATSEPTAAVSLGDSYISGDGGRWAGNSSTNTRSRQGTDRAAYRRGWFWRYDTSRVYGDSGACRRSDVAPIQSAGLAVDAVFNLGCSGASTTNVLPAAAGGRSNNGEAPQIDQLAVVAQSHDVEVVVISIGGNDLNFSSVIIDCVLGYTTSPAWRPNTCAGDQDRNLAQGLPAMLADVRRVLTETRAVLDANGDGDARIIVQSYPSPVAEASNIRYGERGWERTFRGGCPFWDSDLGWANDTLIPQITAGLATEAAATGSEFLDLSDALKGHEACAGTARQGTAADGVGVEWIRYINTGIRQGVAEESAHPNAYGQRALGRCLVLAIASPSTSDRCVNTPGSGVTAMRLG